MQVRSSPKAISGQTQAPSSSQNFTAVQASLGLCHVLGLLGVGRGASQQATSDFLVFQFLLLALPRPVEKVARVVQLGDPIGSKFWRRRGSSRPMNWLQNFTFFTHTPLFPNERATN